MSNTIGWAEIPPSGRGRIGLFRAAISRGALEAIRECTHKGWALGSEHFREQIEKVSGRRAASKEVGRPKKESDRV
jgi:putative transposase